MFTGNGDRSAPDSLEHTKQMHRPHLVPAETSPPRTPQYIPHRVSDVPVPVTEMKQGGKNPNFLQKLYEFLAIDPHPFPDVIYWATDSKQLVIAKPDILARKVLPRLFKHDKISSFGRQLNIYGFARVFPGRQFKDAKGNLLDASTLHRESTQEEILSVKRRAAPKLFRNRRLADGQVIRTKAGPEVERKFKEIKQDIAAERKVKLGWGGGCATKLSLNTSRGANGELIREVLGEYQRGDVKYQSLGENRSSRLAGSTFTGRSTDYAVPPSSDKGRLQGRGPGLSDIYEGIPLSPESCLSPPRFQYSRFQSLQSPTFAQDVPEFLDLNLKSSTPYLQDGTFVENSFTSHNPVSARLHRSCPASIHTSPVFTSKITSSVANGDGVGKGTSNTLPLTIDTGGVEYVGSGQYANGQHRLTEPATNPFANFQPIPDTGQNQTIQAISPDSLPRNYISPISSDDSYSSLMPSFSTPLTLIQELTAQSTSTTRLRLNQTQLPLVPNSVDVSQETSVYPQERSWERTGIIDPRWVSPRGSAWNTPAQTPRSGSPLQSFNVLGGAGSGVAGGMAFPVSQDRGMGAP